MRFRSSKKRNSERKGSRLDAVSRLEVSPIPNAIVARNYLGVGPEGESNILVPSPIDSHSSFPLGELLVVLEFAERRAPSRRNPLSGILLVQVRSSAST